MDNSSLCIIILILINVLIWIIASLFSKSKKKNTIFLVISFVSLWVFLLIREPYSDMNGYISYFGSINTNNFNMVLENRWEVLFKVLLFIIKIFTSDYRVMMGIVAALTLIGPFLFIKKYSNNYPLSIVMFISMGSYYLHFYVLRQALALSVFLAFFYLIGERKMIKYFIAIIIASLFHKTAIVLLLLYPLVNIPPSKHKRAIITIVAIIFILFSPQISNFLISDFYSQYFDRFVVGAGIKLLMFYGAMIIIYTLSKPRLHSVEKKEIVSSSLFTVFIQLMTVQNNVFSRVATYTRDSFCILIPNLANELSGKNKLLFDMAIIVLSICFVLITNDYLGYTMIL